jgi:hypothetical protein
MNKKIIAIVLIVAGLSALFFTAKKTYLSKPQVVILQVPFTPQAPTNNWNRNEDCEETSITMAQAFLNGNMDDRLPAGIAQASINSLKKWEQSNLGYNANTGADATTKMAEGVFSMKIKQISNYTEQDLKDELIKHHPILLPINARLLGNPKYQNSGPLYHMIVVRGFKGDTFIVNDPGTDSGDGNEYPFSTLKKAAADWNNAAKTMNMSRKIALVASN